MSVENTTFEYKVIEMEVAIAHHKEVVAMLGDMKVVIIEVCL